KENRPRPCRGRSRRRTDLAADHVNIFPPKRGKYWRGDDSPLRMEVREQNKIVELWLTREEKKDAAFRESLKPLYQQYKAQNYLVAVFLSGEADLYQQTRDLLLYNRRRQAEKEVLAQKQAQQAMTM
ncbi:hypothetical protein, partial [Dysosmobacter sp.]|uniref:hypothetical protein n=1 Tax=Dysosmobacter sp. TaxID=2591382 RepID=UPI003AB45D76